MLRHHDHGPAMLGNTYQIREKLIAVGDDFWIEDSNGNRIYKMNGKALRVRDTTIMEDTQGHELLKIQHKLMHVRKTTEIERNGQTVASVHKRKLTIREHFVVERNGRGDLEIVGNIVEHDYHIKDNSVTIAQVSKAWFRVRDTYGVSIAPEQDDALLLAIVICIDQMSHDD